MNAIVPLAVNETRVVYGAYCDTCGGIPCAYPPFCEACRSADLRRGFKPRSLKDDLQLFARRTRELAAHWTGGHLSKKDAVDRAYHFAVALGLHYRLARSAKEFLRDEPVDLIQRVLAAAFAAPVGHA